MIPKTLKKSERKAREFLKKYSISPETADVVEQVVVSEQPKEYVKFTYTTSDGNPINTSGNDVILAKNEYKNNEGHIYIKSDSNKINILDLAKMNGAESIRLADNITEITIDENITGQLSGGYLHIVCDELDLNNVDTVCSNLFF